MATVTRKEPTREEVRQADAILLTIRLIDMIDNYPMRKVTFGSLRSISNRLEEILATLKDGE